MSSMTPDRLRREIRDLERRLGDSGEDSDPIYAERYRYFRPLMRRYTMTEAEKDTAAHRLAAGEPNFMDMVRYYHAARDLGLAPPPESEASCEAWSRTIWSQLLAKYRDGRDMEGYADP